MRAFGGRPGRPRQRAHGAAGGDHHRIVRGGVGAVYALLTSGISLDDIPLPNPPPVPQYGER